MTILELLSTKVTLPASSTYDRSFLGPVGLDMVNGHWSMSLSWMLPCVAFHSLVMVLAMIMVRVRIMVEVMDTVIVMAQIVLVNVLIRWMVPTLRLKMLRAETEMLRRERRTSWSLWKRINIIKPV